MATKPAAPPPTTTPPLFPDDVPSIAPPTAPPPKRPLFAHEAGLQETLSREDFRRIADVRRNIWRDAMLGLAAGLGGGWALARVLARRAAGRAVAAAGSGGGGASAWRGQHTGAVVLASGALASFFAAMRRGRPEVEAVGDVFTRHAAPDAARFPYEARQHALRLQGEASERERGDALLRRLEEREAERRR